jgi:hypothetical protein
MKKMVLVGTVAAIIIGGVLPLRMQRTSASNAAQASVTGRVSPPEGADVVWLIGTGDSVKTSVAYGNFSIQVKPGKYRLLVDAKTPYRDAQLNNLEVKADQMLDVGEIILQK